MAATFLLRVAASLSVLEPCKLGPLGPLGPLDPSAPEALRVEAKVSEGWPETEVQRMSGL